MNKATLIANLLIAALPAMSCAGSADGRQKETESMYKYTIVSEDATHEGTWLAWPHRPTYGTAYRDSIEPVWVAMAAALSGGEPYRVVQMPLTRKNVRGLGYKGSYLNFYVGNTVVLMPAYGDANDSVAVRMLTELYPGRRVVPIDVAKLYKHGGMLHCVTRQQPAARQ